MTLPPLDLLLSPWVLALLGLCIGSFLNVVIHRMPMRLERDWQLESAEILGFKIDAGDGPVALSVNIHPQGLKPSPASQTLQVGGPITLSTPRSRCPSCGHAIAWYENIPVLSYLWLRGKCSNCKTGIALRYPLVELFTGVMFAAVGWRFGAQPTTLLWCGFVAVLIALSGIDWDTTFLFDDLTLPLLWAGLVCAAMGWTVPLPAALWGAVAGYLSLWSVDRLFKLVTRRDEGMGSGDFKLLAALGAWLGLPMVLPIVLAASIVGAVVGLGMKASGALREGKFVPFGPFLAGGALVVMLAGSERVTGWLGWT